MGKVLLLVFHPSQKPGFCVNLSVRFTRSRSPFDFAQDKHFGYASVRRSVEVFGETDFFCLSPKLSLTLH